MLSSIKMLLRIYLGCCDSFMLNLAGFGDFWNLMGCLIYELIDVLVNGVLEYFKSGSIVLN